MSTFEKINLEGDLGVPASVGPKPIMLGAGMVEKLKAVRKMGSAPIEQPTPVVEPVTSVEEPKVEETPVEQAPLANEANPEEALQKAAEALAIASEIINNELAKIKKPSLEEQVQKIAQNYF